MKKLLILLAIATSLYACNTSKKIGDKDRIVLIETQYGDMKIKLYDQTPKHRDNFVKLASEGFFDATLFHRVIQDFMIQGGDPDSKGAEANKMLGEGGPGYQIDAEFNNKLFHKKGVLAAAREGDASNPERKSAGSQFYIAKGRVYTAEELDKAITKINAKRLARSKNNVLEDNEKFVLSEAQKEAYTTIGGIPHLDGQYTVFGEVIEGLNVIDSIAKVKTNMFDRPLEDIKIKVKVIE